MKYTEKIELQTKLLVPFQFSGLKECVLESSFPVTREVGIFVQLQMEINWKHLRTESVLMHIYICHGVLNLN